MIESRFSPLAVRAFEAVFGPWRRARTARILLAGLPRTLPDGPVVLAANHGSWWDPFVLREVQRALRPGAPLFHVMLERELARRPLLRVLGAVGLEPGSPSSLRACLRLLRRRIGETPDAFVAFYPQGRIWPTHRRPLGFRPGVELLARRIGASAVVPVALHTEPLNAPGPTLLASVGDVIAGDDVSVEVIESAVERALDGLLAFAAARGEALAEAWPAPHDPVPEVAR